MKERHYKIGKDGGLFYGTLAQFEDCFGGVHGQESGLLDFARRQHEPVEILLGHDGISLTLLNFACGLEGGGYSFESPPAALEELGVVVWDDPKTDTIPWIQDGDFEFSDVLSPLYAFAPDALDVGWPDVYQDGDNTYVLITQGIVEATDRDCDCHGKLVPIPEPKLMPLFTWEFTGNVLDKPNPLCPHCEGTGTFESTGGSWALYGTLPEQDCDPDAADYIGNEHDGVHYLTMQYCGKYFVTAWIDSETGHFTENILTNVGPYETIETAEEAGQNAATEWCLDNDVVFAEGEID